MAKLSSLVRLFVYTILGLSVIINSIDCYGQDHEHQHHHHNYRYHTRHHHHKRRADGDGSLETSSYRRTITIQETGKPPVEKKYQWSSSSDSNQPATDDKNSQILRETIRRITTTTLTEDNVIDKKPIYSPDGILSSNNQQPLDKISYVKLSSSAEQNITCPQNQYGNVVVGCKKCQCNGNIDLTDIDNCDSLTGVCLKCLYNTVGDHCEQCKNGYTGEATKQLCHECVCNQLGTDPKAGPCNPTTGQCPCFPHVDGIDCGKCKAGYYNLTTAKGCQPCECDPTGSSSNICSELTGICTCNPGFSGRQCNECPDGSFGNPKYRCQACNCNKDGSINQYCDNKTGQCRCITGIGGEKCDHCARGYFGQFPNCESCGECFEQWDAIIRGLKNQTQALLDKVKLLLKIGTVGDYGREFGEIEMKLDRIKSILDNQKLDEDAIRDLARQLEELARLLKYLQAKLSEYEREAEQTTNRTIAVQDALRDYARTAERLHMLIDGLRENATQFQEWNVDGAYGIILDSQNRSRQAEKLVRDLKPLMLEQEKKRRLTENMLITTSSRYNSSSLQNEAILANFARQINELENNVPGINQLVCASTSTVNNCDQLCGGALCNKCGGISCAEGATTKANNALDLAKQAMDLLNQKYNQAKLNLEALLEARNMSEEALKQARLVMTDCDLQKSKFDKIGNELNGIMDGVDKFALVDGARPAEVRTLGNECLSLSISLTPDQILDLAKKINETLSSLTNIDKILQETAGDLNTAEQLHRMADHAKEMADNILDTVEQVLEMLRLAAIEQAKAAAAIAAATADIEGAQGDLVEITTETDRLVQIVKELSDAIKKLRDRLNELRKKYAQNELYVSQAKAAADEASKLTDQAEKGTDELAEKVRLAEERLRNKARQSGEARDRAERLKNDALQLAAEIQLRMNLLRELDDQFDEYVERVKDYQDIVDDLHKQMNQYIKDINVRAQYYRECQT